MRRRVLDQRSRGEPLLGQRLGIEKRLERRARLAQRHHAIDFARLAQRARRTHPGQHFTAGVVEHHHRAVFDIAALQFAQMLLQAVHRMALHRRAQRAAHGARGRIALLRQHPARKMRRHAVGRGPLPLAQAVLGEQRQCLAVHGRLLLLLQQGAGPLRDAGRRSIRRAHQHRGHGGFARVEAMGGLAEQRARQRVDAHQFAAKRHQVQIGLEDLVLAPAPVEHLGGHALAELLHQRAPARAALPVTIDQAGQLHADGACAARALVPQPAPGRRRHCSPIDAAVFIEPLVFAEHQRRAQGRGYISQRHPFAAAHAGVGAQPLQHFAFARQHQGVGGTVRAAHFVVAGQGPGRGGRGQHSTQRQCMAPGAQFSSPRHCAQPSVSATG